MYFLNNQTQLHIWKSDELLSNSQEILHINGISWWYLCKWKPFFNQHIPVMISLEWLLLAVSLNT